MNTHNARHKVAIWDLPVRLFHWLLAAAVIGAIATAQIGGNLMIWHGRLGSLALGLIVFRLVWGVIGTRTARFAEFVRGPAAIRAYLAGEWNGIGHNPLGALSVLALLGVVGFQALTGHFATDDIAFNGPLAALLEPGQRDLATRWHYLSANLLYALIGLHLAAVGFYLRVRKQNLVVPMLLGQGDAPVGAVGNSDSRHSAFALALLLALLVVWGAQGGWIEIPPPISPATNYNW
jgi:cytochrome b